MRRRALLAAAATTSTLGVAGCTALGDDCPAPPTDPDPPDGSWPTTGFDRANTDHAPGGPGPSSERWRYQRGSEAGQYLYGFFPQPLVADGAVHVAMRTGDSFGGREYHGNVLAVDDDRVYVTHAEDRDDETVAVVRAVTHDDALDWIHEFPVGRGTPNAPAVADGRVVVTGGDRLRVLDADEGERSGQFVFGYEHAGAPATDGTRAYVAAKNLYAVGLDDATRHWRVVNRATTDGVGGWTDGIPFLARPAVADGAVYHRAAAYDARTGDRRWGSTADDEVTSGNYATHEYGRRPFALPAITADALYLAHQHRGVVKYA